jgi:hypothetical protein
MQFVRRSTLVAAATLLTVSLFWFIGLFGLYQIIGSSAEIKHALQESGIYKTVISDVLAQVQKSEQKKGGQGEMNIDLKDPKVLNIVNQAFPPPYLQTQTEGVLDSTFAWMKGDTPKLSFAIDIKDAKVRLADGLAVYTHDKAATLPPCPPAALPSGDFDVFNATCLPPGMSASMAAEQARKQILEGEFLKDTQLSADSIKNDKGQTLGEQLKHVPVAYQRIQNGILWLGGLAALLGVAVVFLSATRRSGVRKVSVISVVVGSLSILLNVMAGMAIKAVNSQFAAKPDMDQPLQRSMFKVLESLVLEARTWWLGIGIALLAAGIAALIALHVTRPKQSAAEGEKVRLPVGDDAIGQKPETAKPAPAKSPPKRPEKQKSTVS